MGAYKKDRDKLSSRACCSGTRSNAFTLKGGRSRIDIRKTFFKMIVVKHWLRLPSEGVDASLSGNIQGQYGRGSEQPGLVEDVLMHCRWFH